MNTSVRDYNYITFQLSWELIERENVFDQNEELIRNELPWELSNSLWNIFYVPVSMLLYKIWEPLSLCRESLYNCKYDGDNSCSTADLWRTSLSCFLCGSVGNKTWHDTDIHNQGGNRTSQVSMKLEIIFIYSVKVFAHSFMVLRCFY